MAQTKVPSDAFANALLENNPSAVPCFGDTAFYFSPTRSMYFNFRAAICGRTPLHHVMPHTDVELPLKRVDPEFNIVILEVIGKLLIVAVTPVGDDNNTTAPTIEALSALTFAVVARGRRQCEALARFLKANRGSTGDTGIVFHGSASSFFFLHPDGTVSRLTIHPPGNTDTDIVEIGEPVFNIPAKETKSSEIRCVLLSSDMEVLVLVRKKNAVAFRCDTTLSGGLVICEDPVRSVWIVDSPDREILIVNSARHRYVYNQFDTSRIVRSGSPPNFDVFVNPFRGSGSGDRIHAVCVCRKFSAADREDVAIVCRVDTCPEDPTGPRREIGNSCPPPLDHARVASDADTPVSALDPSWKRHLGQNVVAAAKHLERMRNSDDFFHLVPAFTFRPHDVVQRKWFGPLDVRCGRKDERIFPGPPGSGLFVFVGNEAPRIGFFDVTTQRFGPSRKFVRCGTTRGGLICIKVVKTEVFERSGDGTIQSFDALPLAFLGICGTDRMESSCMIWYKDVSAEQASNICTKWTTVVAPLLPPFAITHPERITVPKAGTDIDVGIPSRNDSVETLFQRRTGPPVDTHVAITETSVTVNRLVHKSARFTRFCETRFNVHSVQCVSVVDMYVFMLRVVCSSVEVLASAIDVKTGTATPVISLWTIPCSAATTRGFLRLSTTVVSFDETTNAPRSFAVIAHVDHRSALAVFSTSARSLNIAPWDLRLAHRDLVRNAFIRGKEFVYMVGQYAFVVDVQMRTARFFSVGSIREEIAAPNMANKTTILASAVSARTAVVRIDAVFRGGSPWSQRVVHCVLGSNLQFCVIDNAMVCHAIRVVTSKPDGFSIESSGTLCPQHPSSFSAPGVYEPTRNLKFLFERHQEATISTIRTCSISATSDAHTVSLTASGTLTITDKVRGGSQSTTSVLCLDVCRSGDGRVVFARSVEGNRIEVVVTGPASQRWCATSNRVVARFEGLRDSLDPSRWIKLVAIQVPQWHGMYPAFEKETIVLTYADGTAQILSRLSSVKADGMQTTGKRPRQTEPASSRKTSRMDVLD